MDTSILPVIKAKRASVKFGGIIEVDGYLMPSGEFRVGITGASESVGFSKEYLTALAKKSPRQLEALQSKGFTGLAETVQLERISGGGGSAKTISLDDYKKLILFAAYKGNPKAQALNEALLTVSLEDFFRTAFAIPLMSMAEKKAVVEKIIQSHYLEHQWEIADRRLPGDDLYLPMGVN
jgi:hypothetical protein